MSHLMMAAAAASTTPHQQMPVKGARQAPIELQGEVKIDSPLVGKIEASNGIAYLAVAFLGAALLLGVYLKFRRHIHGAFKRKSRS